MRGEALRESRWLFSTASGSEEVAKETKPDRLACVMCVCVLMCWCEYA